MGYTKKIKAGLVKKDYTTFVGEDGTLFYNFDNGTLRISDGVTPGGQPVNLIGDFSDIAIGNITVDDTTIKPNTLNADLNLETTGTGVIHLTTPVHITKATIDGDNIVTIRDDGQVKIIVDTADSTEGAVAIVGNTLGAYQSPIQTGVMLHVTGQTDDVSRVYVDGVNNYTVFTGRRYNGAPDTPTAVLANEVIARYGSNAYNGSAWNTGGVARIQMIASENHTGSAAGTRLEFWATPNGTATVEREAYVDGNGLTAVNLTTTGRANITNMNVTDATPLLTVSANAQGLTKVPALAGTTAQFTAKDASRHFVVQDTYGLVSGNALTYGGEYTFRTARGTNASPTAVQVNDVLGKIGGAGWGTTGYGGVLSGSVEFQAAENFTDSSRGGKMVVKLIPQGSNTPAVALTLTPTALTLASGSSITGRLKATAGTTDDPSIQLSAGPLPTVALPGAISYNGIALYGVPQDNEIGVIPTEQVYVLNDTRNLTAGVTTAQSVFGKTVHVSANTRYSYVLRATVLKNGSASNTPTLNYGISVNGGSLFAHGYSCWSSVGTTGGAVTEIRTTSVMTNYVTTGFSTGVPVTAAMGVSTAYANIEIRGWISVNLATNIDFQLAFSAAPNTSCSIQPTASVRIHPVSAAGADTSIGSWA